MSRFWLTSGVRAPGSAEKRHGRLHRRCPPTPGNCDHNAHSSCRACDRIAGYVSAPLRTYGSHDVFPGTSRTVVWLLGEKCENDHCVHIVGRNRTVAGGALGSGWKSIEKRLQMALLSAPWGPNSTTKQKSQKMVGEKII